MVFSTPQARPKVPSIEGMVPSVVVATWVGKVRRHKLGIPTKCDNVPEEMAVIRACCKACLLPAGRNNTNSNRFESLSDRSPVDWKGCDDS